MKRLCAVLLALLLACTALCGFAAAEGDTASYEFEFGLFTVEFPASAEVQPEPGSVFAEHELNVSGVGTVYANSAPLDEYDSTAGVLFDSVISMVFALSTTTIDNYSETEITEETLPNGLTLRWQLMRGDITHSIWFEVKSENYGYNMVISGDPTERQDELMLQIMRSFSCDAVHELDLINFRQTDLGDSRFVSVEHGLQITLEEPWRIMPEEKNMMYNTSSFLLDYEDGRRLIQLMYDPYCGAYTADYIMELYMQLRRDSFGNEYVTYSDPYTVTLENLGVEAVLVDENNGVNMINIAFVHNGYAYYGSFMWIPEDEEVARPFMEAAIQSLCLPE